MIRRVDPEAARRQHLQGLVEAVVARVADVHAAVRQVVGAARADRGCAATEALFRVDQMDAAAALLREALDAEG